MNSKWKEITMLQAGAIVDDMVMNIEPINDLKEHTGRYCDCKPRYETDGRSLIVVHNSYDGREVQEALNDLSKVL